MNLIEIYIKKQMPWDREPWRQEFIYKGFHCMILKHLSLKHLCGYVAVPIKTYNMLSKEKMFFVHVHGGITCSEIGNDTTFPKSFDGSDMWWLGFDCAHIGDLVPSLYEIEHNYPYHDNEKYKNSEYVRNELESMVDQIISLL
jgi:hypothetical protein